MELDNTSEKSDCVPDKVKITCHDPNRMLVEAVNKNDISKVREALAADANPDPFSGRTQIRLLGICAHAGNAEVLKLLLASGAAPVSCIDYGITPLQRAAGHGITKERYTTNRSQYMACMWALLKAGTDVNGYADSNSHDSMPPLHLAAEKTACRPFAYCSIIMPTLSAKVKKA